MWRAIERRSRQDDPWVGIFLGFVKEAVELPGYHYSNRAERLKLSQQIADTARQLSDLLKQNQLDCHLIHLSGLNFNGFYIYEEFGESNRARMDASEIQKLPVSQIIHMAVERARERIKAEPVRGKGGRNARPIRFVRHLAASLERYYGQPLVAAVGTAANTIYGTDYSPGDIQNLLSR